MIQTHSVYILVVVKVVKKDLQIYTIDIEFQKI